MLSACLENYLAQQSHPSSCYHPSLLHEAWLAFGSSTSDISAWREDELVVSCDAARPFSAHYSLGND